MPHTGDHTPGDWKIRSKTVLELLFLTLATRLRCAGIVCEKEEFCRISLSREMWTQSSERYFWWGSKDIIYCNRVAITAAVDKQRNGLRQQQQQHSMVRAERNRDRYFMAINKLTRSTALVSRVGKQFVENSLRRLDNLIILAASCH